MEKDTIYLIDGSKKLNRNVPLGVIGEFNKFRPIEARVIDEPYLNEFARKTNRGKVNYLSLCDNVINYFVEDAPNIQTKIDRLNGGKLIILDEDIRSDRTNVSFGGSMSCRYGGLGTSVVSTARLPTVASAKHVIRHELGHMFGAANEGRSNTKYTMGWHCTNDLCTMQQKANLEEAINYAHEIKNSKKKPFCPQCEEDIQKYTYNKIKN